MNKVTVLQDSPKMNSLVKERWLEALRSGKYKQAQNLLKHTDKNNENPEFCCLGVLCELAVESNIISPSEMNIDEEWAYMGHSDLTPPEVSDWAGFSDSNPEVAIDDDLRYTLCLSDLNDTYAYDFEKIADIIEEVL